MTAQRNALLLALCIIVPTILSQPPAISTFTATANVTGSNFPNSTLMKVIVDQAQFVTYGYDEVNKTMIKSYINARDDISLDFIVEQGLCKIYCLHGMCCRGDAVTNSKRNFLQNFLDFENLVSFTEEQTIEEGTSFCPNPRDCVCATMYSTFLNPFRILPDTTDAGPCSNGKGQAWGLGPTFPWIMTITICLDSQTNVPIFADFTAGTNTVAHLTYLSWVPEADCNEFVHPKGCVCPYS